MSLFIPLSLSPSLPPSLLPSLLSFLLSLSVWGWAAVTNDYYLLLREPNEVRQARSRLRILEMETANNLTLPLSFCFHSFLPASSLSLLCSSGILTPRLPASYSYRVSTPTSGRLSSPIVLLERMCLPCFWIQEWHKSWSCSLKEASAQSSLQPGLWP